MKEEILRMEHICKSFSDIRVLSDFKLNIFSGEILGLLGLRHTGKTTIAKIIAGLETIDSGVIYYEEEELEISNVRTARELGIYFIQNRRKVISQLTVAENIFVLRDDNLNGFYLNKNLIFMRTKKILSKLELDFLPETKVENLTRVQQCLVEIAKAVAENAKLIIIDGIIDDSYTRIEIDMLKKVILNLNRQGVSFLISSYKPEELTKFVDRLIILRNGKNIKSLYRDRYDNELIYSLMIGYRFTDNHININKEPGKEILRVENLNTELLTDINFRLREGEVLGIYDIENISNIDLASVLCGQSDIITGNIVLNNKNIKIRSIGEAISNGIGIIPRDGVNSNLFMNMNFLDNITFLILKKLSNKISVLNKRMLKFLKSRYIEEIGLDEANKNKEVDIFDIYTKQRILLNKWLLYRPKVLIFINPMDNIDIISEEIFIKYLREFVKNKTSVIIITSNITEVSSVLLDRLILLKNDIILNECSQSELKNINISNIY